MDGLVVKVGEGGAFGRCRHGALFLADDDGSASEAVARGYDSVVSHEQHGAGTFYLVVYVLDALLEGFPLVYEERHEFGLVGVARREFGEVCAAFEQLILQLLDIVDFRYGDDGEAAEVRVYDDGLGVGVGDDSDAGIPLEFTEVLLEFCSEVRAFEVMD